MIESYIYKKEVDWSVLNYGINIPVSFQDVFYTNMKFRLKRGESKKIKLIFEQGEYPVMLINQAFNERKYPNHRNILQMRYTPKSEIAKTLRTIFNSSCEYLYKEKALLINKRKQIIVPENIKEYIAVYATPIDDTFLIECITNDEIIEAKKSLQKFTEFEIEQLMTATDSSSIISKIGVIKIRKLDNSIADALKTAYKYKCQICGLNIGELYDVSIIHAHHIEYFSVSLNNNADNIMIICPNHHSIIHNTNPIFDRKQKVYIYPNGYREGLALNKHL